MVTKHINEYCVKHDYVHCMMVKTTQASDLNVHATFLSKMVVSHYQHLRELYSVTKSAFQT